MSKFIVMKKIPLLLISAALLYGKVSAQTLPSFQFGVKAGTNLTSFSPSKGAGNLGGDNQAGYFGGIWATMGAVGVHFQPELYFAAKDFTLNADDGNKDKVRVRSLDLPLLVGTRIGALGFGAHFNTGPVFSYAISKDQTFSTDVAKVFSLDLKSANFAWQVGAGIDVKRFSLDLRYEAGLNSISTANGGSTHINLFELGLAYRLAGF